MKCDYSKSMLANRLEAVVGTSFYSLMYLADKLNVTEQEIYDTVKECGMLYTIVLDNGTIAVCPFLPEDLTKDESDIASIVIKRDYHLKKELVIVNRVKALPAKKLKLLRMLIEFDYDGLAERCMMTQLETDSTIDELVSLKLMYIRPSGTYGITPEVKALLETI